MKIGYINIFVADLTRSVTFFRDILGLTCHSAEVEFGYASFAAGPISFGIAQTDDADLVGRHTGVGFMVDDIDAEYQRLSKLGVEFSMPPTLQPWGGILALFNDPDGNIYYLDPGHPH